MTPWMFLLNPFERWPPLLDDPKRVFDLWQEGGVRGIVVGRLVFTAPDGSQVPTFVADPSVYAGFGVAPPPEQGRDPAKEARFQALLDDAAARGWQIMVFDVRHDGGHRPGDEDPHGAVHTAAAAQDILNAYPQAHGVILDGPGEQPYELQRHRNREFLALEPAQRTKLGALGYDVDRLDRGVAALRRAFAALTPASVGYWAGGGAMGALELFDLEEDTLYWLRARREATRGWMAATQQQLARLDRPAKTGVIPRTAAFSALTGQDYRHLGAHFDYVFPKHYFWDRGFDGLYGSVRRWVRQIGAWNPSLSETECFAVMRLWLGLELPEVASLDDMEGGFPDAFFAQVVAGETRRALAAVGDPDRVVAWVSSGRLPHGGDMMPARDLQRMLEVSATEGLRRFVFHATHLLGAAEWRVMSRLCGTPWRDDDAITWPADMDHNVVYFSGRPNTDPAP